MDPGVVHEVSVGGVTATTSSGNLVVIVLVLAAVFVALVGVMVLYHRMIEALKKTAVELIDTALRIRFTEHEKEEAARTARLEGEVAGLRHDVKELRSEVGYLRDAVSAGRPHRPHPED